MDAHGQPRPSTFPPYAELRATNATLLARGTPSSAAVRAVASRGKETLVGEVLDEFDLPSGCPRDYLDQQRVRELADYLGATAASGFDGVA